MYLRKSLLSSLLIAVSLFGVKALGENVTMIKGTPISLQCSPDAAGDVKWYKDGAELKIDENSKIYQHVPANNTLILLKPDPADGGPYVCSYNLNGAPVNETIEVFVPAHVKKFDRSKNLVQGDNLVLDCKAFGYPEPIIYWLKGDVPVNSLGDDRVSFEAYNGIENATLLIKDLNFDDRSEYTCTASNDFGSHNNTILVRVKDKLAALWPFLAICAEVTILCIIIFIYERRRAKKMEQEEMADMADQDMTNSNDHKGKEDDVRHRKQ